VDPVDRVAAHKIAHGGEIPDAEYVFDDGVPHH